ncbi:type VI secretion system tip protein TssI/VgrG [Parendozoicomonas sp. Alg238-R29]|uniref:type VI secretion system Vgr family protein n=1 Tax=Parendozoicomonas sp. Alg238-R29 TaxID=2993446 RepID=UPI00248D645B|nr:type VI secretion system tip protein TssI/VgrG [Parendozoicomonas sp. Alg238-R29]
MTKTAGQLTPNIRPLTATSEDGQQWILNRLIVDEHVCQTFVMEADLLYDQPEAPDLLGQSMAINYRPGLQGSRQQARNFHGVITDIALLHSREADNLQTCRLTLRPWLQLLDLRDNCRIFQNQNSKKIITSLLSEHGLGGDCTFKNSGSPKERNYCAQYNETDFVFIDRLLREEGMHWFFHHESNKHQLIVGDSNQSFQKCCDDLEYYRDATDLENALTHWQPHLQLQMNTQTSGSYTDEQAEVISSSPANSRHHWNSNLKLAAYRYSGHGRDRDQTAELARFQMESKDCRYLQIQGRSAEPSLQAGGRFKLARHPDKSQIRDYLLLSVKHCIESTEKRQGVEYSNQFTCQPVDWPFRPYPAHPVHIPGLQSATVTGPDNSEAHTDDQGRIMVRFHWDREDNPDDHSSCWLRVLQPMAGDSFGCHTLPRVGQEVLVGFLNGEADQPVVVGCLYNGRLNTPNPSAEVSGFLSRSTPDAGSDHANELRIDDTKDSELFYLQAQKDMTTLVRNDRTITVEGKDTLEITKETSWQCKDQFQHTIDKTAEVKSTDAMTLETSASMSCKASQSLECTAGTDGKFDAGTSLTLSAPSISINGQTSIELSVGGSKISIGPASVEISAPQVTIKGQATAEINSVMTTIKGTAKVEVSGTLASLSGNAMAEVKAPAMVQIQGGLAKIN